MTRHLCRECRLDLTAVFYEKYGAAMKNIYPSIKAMTDELKETGATNIKATIKKVGTAVVCSRCNTKNEIVLDTMDKIEEMVREMNR